VPFLPVKAGAALADLSSTRRINNCLQFFIDFHLKLEFLTGRNMLPGLGLFKSTCFSLSFFI
jgi:hypothetical protein